MEEVRSSGRLKSSHSSYCFDTRIYQSVTFHCFTLIAKNMRRRKYTWHPECGREVNRTDGWIAEKEDGQIRKWKTTQRKVAGGDVLIRVLWMEYDCSGVRKERYPVHTHTLCFLAPPDIIIWSRRWWCHRLWSRECFICSRAHIYFSLSHTLSLWLSLLTLSLVRSLWLLYSSESPGNINGGQDERMEAGGLVARSFTQTHSSCSSFDSPAFHYRFQPDLADFP